MYFIRSVKGTTSFPCGKHLVRSKMMCLFWITTSLFIRFKKRIHIKHLCSRKKAIFSRTDLGSGKITR